MPETFRINYIKKFGIDNRDIIYSEINGGIDSEGRMTLWTLNKLVIF